MTAEQTVATGLRDVERVFRAQIADNRQPGACLAVYHRGSLVLDLVGGLADTQQGRRVASNTPFVLFSSTKPLASTCLHILIERGKLTLDTPVAEVWPGFGKNGKEGITVRHVLTHRAGMPDTPTELTPQTWADWDAVVVALENATPRFAPGTTSAYHTVTHGWLAGEIVRRVDGRPIADFLRDEMLAPLGMNDTYLGLPAQYEWRVARLHAMEDVDDFGLGTVQVFNMPEVHRAVVPAGNGISTARDMARFYAMLLNGGELDGVRILQPETVERARAVAVEGDKDMTLGLTVRRGLGFNLGGLPGWSDRFGVTSTARTFGHGGAGTSICWADPDLDVAMVFIPNGFRADASNVARCREISDAVRTAFT